MKVSWYQNQPTYLKNFADHLLRWNKGINLISRKGTRELLGDLYRQSLGGFAALWSQLETWGIRVSEPGA